MNLIRGKKCLLDTNVLLYARDKRSLHHAKAAELFREIDKQTLTAYVSVQNILEYSAVLTRVYKVSQKEVQEDIELLRTYRYLTVLYPTSLEFSVYLDLLRKNTGVYIFDLYLASTAIVHSLDYIVSDDVDFELIDETKLYNPFRT